MIMRAPANDLPIMLSEVAIVAGELTILDDISLTLASGAPTVLIGPNGAGKTTLLRAAMGLIPVTRGRITWGGRDASPPDRRAILFQRPVMFRRSGAGNVRYALAAAGGGRAPPPPPNEEIKGPGPCRTRATPGTAVVGRRAAAAGAGARIGA
jgi:tungstate transport system ATP-binding protein